MIRPAPGPPLAFKYFVGGFINTSPDGKQVEVRRVKQSSDIAVAFSARPVGINEKIGFRFKKTTGSIRFGFSLNDPGILNVLPTTDCASKFFQSPGWSTRLSRESSEIDDIWYYYADVSGDIHLARNSKDVVVYYSKVNPNCPLWAIILIDADNALEFVDPKTIRVGPPAKRTRRQLVLDETENATSFDTEKLCFQNISEREVILSEDYPISKNTDMSTNILYSNRPMMVNEMVCLSFSEIELNSLSTIKFGFTRCDSEGIDWVVTLERDLFKEGNILHFFMNSSGDIQYGVNGKDVKQICFGIDTSISFWGTIQFHKICTLHLYDSLKLLIQWVSDNVNETVPVATQGILSNATELIFRRLKADAAYSVFKEAFPQQAASNTTKKRVTSKYNITKKFIPQSSTITSSASSSQSQSTSQSPLHFHSVCGQNIEVSHGGLRVRLRQEDGMGGVAFTARPIRTNEVITFRIIESTYNILFGFTRYDPAQHEVPSTIAFQNSIPPGHWLSSLGHFSIKDNTWYFYVNSSGDIHFGVNGKDVRVYFGELFFHDNDYWAFVEILGDAVLEFVDATATVVGPPAQRTPQELVLRTTAAETCPGFHSTHGKNIKISNDGFTLHSRLSLNYEKDIAFSNRPIKLNEMVNILFVNVVDSSNFIDFGFTRYNPTGNTTLELIPDYRSYEKDNSSGYWISDLKQEYCVTGNILHFHVNDSGDIQYGVNGMDVGIFCAGVDTKKPIWAVVQISSNNNVVQSVPVTERYSAGGIIADVFTGLNIGTQVTAEGVNSELPTEVESTPSIEEEEWVNESRLVPTEVWEEEPVERLEHRTVTEERSVPQVEALYAFTDQDISMTKGEVMFLINKTNPDWWSVRKADRTDGFVPASYVREIEPKVVQLNKETSRQQSVEPSAPPDTECIICTMQDSNTAFSCGHICTCYDCAKEVWKGSGNGRCPICRAKITQILRTYR